MRKCGFSDKVCQYRSETVFASLNLPVGGCWWWDFVQSKCETIQEGLTQEWFSYQVNLLLPLVRHLIHFHRFDWSTLDFGFHCQLCCQYQLVHLLVIPKFYQGQNIHWTSNGKLTIRSWYCMLHSMLVGAWACFEINALFRIDLPSNIQWIESSTARCLRILKDVPMKICRGSCRYSRLWSWR